MQEIGGISCEFLGLCFGFDVEGNNDYMVGIESREENVPGFDDFIVPKSSWLVFEAVGAISENVLGITWKRIYGEFLPQSTYIQASSPTIEVYREWNNDADVCNVEIWIPVEK
jgi:AraC family transcriptional regulator